MGLIFPGGNEEKWKLLRYNHRIIYVEKYSKTTEPSHYSMIAKPTTKTCL